MFAFYTTLCFFAQKKKLQYKLPLKMGQFSVYNQANKKHWLILKKSQMIALTRTMSNSSLQHLKDRNYNNKKKLEIIKMFMFNTRRAFRFLGVSVPQQKARFSDGLSRSHALASLQVQTLRPRRSP